MTLLESPSLSRLTPSGLSTTIFWDVVDDDAAPDDDATPAGDDEGATVDADYDDDDGNKNGVL